MPFLHMTIFWIGLGAVSVPVVIHLLNRRRFRVMDWAAMKFLFESLKKNRRRLRIEELILLALRCLAVLLLAAAARLVGCARGGPLPVLGSRPTMSHVFILDDSVSMGQRLPDTTSFTQAAGELAELIATLPSDDRVAVLLTSRPGADEALFKLKPLSEAQPGSLGRRLASLKPSDTANQLAKAAESAYALLANESNQKRLYLLSDFRKADFAAGSPGLDELRAQFQAAERAGARIALLNYGADPAANLTAERIEVLNRLAIAGQSLRVQLRVRNNGPMRAQDVPVSFIVRGGDGSESKLAARMVRSIEPGGAELVQASCDLPEGISAAVEAQLPVDQLVGDNAQQVAVEVRKARRVLVVDGESDLADRSRGESFYLAGALDPNGDHGYGTEVEVVPAERLGEAAFDRYDAVVLANVGEFPLTGAVGGRQGYEQLAALARYVQGGGGLCIFTGDRLNPVFYNGPFHDGGNGLCPARVGPPVGSEKRTGAFVRLLPASISPLPVMRVFQGDRSEFTQFVRFYGYTPLELPPAAAGGEGATQVLARFDNVGERGGEHTPAIVTRNFGRGTVVLVASSADAEWTDWPKDVTYLPFLNDVLDFISRSAGLDLTDKVGRPIEYAATGELASASFSLETPAKDVVTPEARQDGPRWVVSYPLTRQAGLYHLRCALPDAAQTVLLARNVDPVEGRLERATEAQLRAQLEVPFDYVDKLAPTAAAAAVVADRPEYWKAALAALLAVLAAEVFLGQRFGHYR